MSRFSLPRGAFAAPLAFALALTPIGCGSGRPPGIADKPGDTFVELSDLAGETKEGNLFMHVHYRFPELRCRTRTRGTRSSSRSTAAKAESSQSASKAATSWKKET